MVTYEGYCRPLKQKVEFVVESINSLDTKRGIKWSVKGNYEGHKISTFTNQDTAQDLLSKMSKNPIEEREVFGAEIAFQEADTVGEMDYEGHIIFCDDDGKGSACEESYCHRCNPIEGCTDHDKCQEIGRFEAEDDAEDMRSDLTAKHYKKDGSLDLRYKICREISATEKKNAESKTVERVDKKTEKITKEDKKVIDEVEDVATEVAVDSVMDAESFDAETYNKVYKAEPNAIIFEENIPAEVWNIMGPDAQGHYLSTRDESVLIAPCCGVTKEELRIDNDANMDCSSCCFSGDDFHPRWWADRPKPEVRLTHGAEEAPMDLTYGNTATVPVDVYYKFMLELPPTVSATVTDDGLSMILGFHNQNADLIDALIEGYSPYQDAGNPEDTLYAEDTLSFVPSDFNSTSFEAESDRLNSHYSNTLKFTDEELDKLGELYMAAESLPFNVEFEDWGKQEMKTHGKDVSFKEWLEEESKSHGNVPLMDWAEHEEESHGERYGAEEFEAEKSYQEKIPPFTDKDIWNQGFYSQKVYPLVNDHDPQKLLTPIENGIPLIESGSIYNLPKVNYDSVKGIQITWGELLKIGKLEVIDNLIHIGGSRYIWKTMKTVFKKLPKNTVMQIKAFENVPCVITFTYEGQEWYYTQAPQLEYWEQDEIRGKYTAETFEERKLKKDSCCCGATKKNPCECMYQGISPCSSTCPCALENKMKEQSAESFEADATSCFQCGRFGYDDEMMRIDYGYLCARCANPDVDFSKIMAAEESPKITKKLIGLLGIGALGAVLAPKEIRKLFDKFKKS